MRKRNINPTRSGRPGRLFEVVLWTIGLVCLSAYGLNKLQSANAQAAAISELETRWIQGNGAEPDQSLWSKQRIARHEESRTGADEMQALALLEIPSVDIRVAVFDGTSERLLDLGVGRVPGTGRVGSTGNLALAGHRDGYFRGLKDIAIGDDVSVRFTSGTSQYEVTGVSIVEPDDISVLATTEESTVTLITCYPFYFVGNAPKRFIVRAVLKADGIEKQEKRRIH